MRWLSVSNVLLAAWLVALAATGGALFLGEVMGQTPCVLCWYQRIAMFPLAVLLGLGAFYDDFGVRRYALPLAMAGGAIALWHTLVLFGFFSEAIQPCVQGGPSCVGADMTVFEIVPIPVLSLIAFAVICLLLASARREVQK